MNKFSFFFQKTTLLIFFVFLLLFAPTSGLIINNILQSSPATNSLASEVAPTSTIPSASATVTAEAEQPIWKLNINNYYLDPERKYLLEPKPLTYLLRDLLIAEPNETVGSLIRYSDLLRLQYPDGIIADESKYLLRTDANDPRILTFTQLIQIWSLLFQTIKTFDNELKEQLTLVNSRDLDDNIFFNELYKFLNDGRGSNDNIDNYNVEDKVELKRWIVSINAQQKIPACDIVSLGGSANFFVSNPKCPKITVVANLEVKAKPLLQLFFAFFHQLYQSLTTSEKTGLNFETVSDSTKILFNENNIVALLTFYKNNFSKFYENFVKKLLTKLKNTKFIFNTRKDSTGNFNKLMTLKQIVTDSTGLSASVLTLAWSKIETIVKNALNESTVTGLLTNFESMNTWIFNFFEINKKVKENSQADLSSEKILKDLISIFLTNEEINSETTATTIVEDASNTPVSVDSKFEIKFSSLALLFFDKFHQHILDEQALHASSVLAIQKILEVHSSNFYDHLKDDEKNSKEFSYSHRVLDSIKIIPYSQNKKAEKAKIFIFQWIDEDGKRYTTGIQKEDAENTFEIVYFATNHYSLTTTELTEITTDETEETS